VSPLALALALATLACGACGGGSAAPARHAARTSVALGAGRPLLTVVERDGDARAAVAIAVTTEGISPEKGAAVAVSIGALVEDRLAAAITPSAMVQGWDGWRLRVLVASPADAARFVDAVRVAMLTPVTASDPALPAVARKIEALARRPLPSPALVEVARCTGEPFGLGAESAPTAAEVEAWRAAAHGALRVAIATAGDASIADAVAAALARAPAWPRGAPIAVRRAPASPADPAVYDASGELAPGAARIVVTAYTAMPERAVAAAAVIGDPGGPLASRLAALAAPAHVRSVVATAHTGGGCLAATVDMSARDLATDVPVHVATAAALARQEIQTEMSDVEAPSDLGRDLAIRASDPREAAELAAWWGLVGRGRGEGEVRLALTVGLAASRDEADGPPVGASGTSTRGAGRTGSPPLEGAVRAAIDRAAADWIAPVVEARWRVERGQGEVWVLLASPCGTRAETSRDAGTGAAVAFTAAMQASQDARGVRVEPFVTSDGIGVISHGPARAGESPMAHARRVADLAARAFAADALDPDRIARARTVLVAEAARGDRRTVAALGAALAPNRPSWVDPWGTSLGLASISDESIAARAAVMRAGPLRVAVIANVDARQAEAATRAVDRWLVRTPGEARTCAPLPGLAAPRAGTYAVEVPAGGSSEALLAAPVPPGDEAWGTAARWVAAALDGPGGLLSRALGGGGASDGGDAPIAGAWSVGLLGNPRSPALVLRLTAPDASLDLAVAQARALLDRLRQGALRDEDRARAAVALAQASVDGSLDPRARAVALWRGESWALAPSLDALRAFGVGVLRDEALIIVAARPPRPTARPTPPGKLGDAGRRQATRPVRPVMPGETEGD
jgi:hypothetical protein